jgi:GWxTD domain-containing protein
MKRNCLLIVCLWIVAVNLVAQTPPTTEPPVPPTNQATTTNISPIAIWADGASYKYFQDSTKSYVEIYLAIQRKDIQFEDVKGTFQGNAFVEVNILDQSGNKVDSLEKYFPMTVSALEEAYKPDYRVFEVFPCLLRPGNYKFKVTAIDILTKRTGVSTFDLNVKDYSGSILGISDIELCYDIVPFSNPDSVASSLIKAGRKVVPNPNKYFSNEDSLLYLFAEVYNLVPNKSELDQFELEMTLLDSYGFELRDYPKMSIKKPGTTAIISQALLLKSLPGGNYQLSLKVSDPATGRKATSNKKFMLIYGFNQLSPSMSTADVFSDSDAALMEQVIRYISNKEERDEFKQLNLEGKKNFLVAFWNRKNNQPGSKVNIYKNEIFRRFNYANHYFSNSLINRSDGWNTDRGRIYIMYGNPDQVDRVPSSMGQKPYEKWTYDRLPGQGGGDVCIFIDENGYGNYKLVHSTIKGEISNPQYEQMIDNNQ